MVLKIKQDLSRTMIHAQAPTKALAWKVKRLTLWSVCFVLYVCTDGRTDTINRNNEPLFKVVLCFGLGRGSILSQNAGEKVQIYKSKFVNMLQYSIATEHILPQDF